MINILFFAQTRERLGCEQLQYPLTSDTTVAALKSQLRLKNDLWNEVLNDSLFCAVNQNLVPLTHPISAGDEVAFFPAVTGG